MAKPKTKAAVKKKPAKSQVRAAAPAKAPKKAAAARSSAKSTKASVAKAAPARATKAEATKTETSKIIASKSTAKPAVETAAVTEIKPAAKPRAAQSAETLTLPAAKTNEMPAPTPKPVVPAPRIAASPASRADLPPSDGYTLLVDGHFKNQFGDLKGAKAAASELKTRFPMLRIEIYDGTTKARLPA